jgi:hypothetical protein
LFESFKIENFMENFMENCGMVVPAIYPEKSGLEKWEREHCSTSHKGSFSSKCQFLNDPKSREP